jgi:type IV secretion system protein TrbF
MKAARSSWRPEQSAETPYQRARQEWDRRMGAATVQAANWRLAAFALMGLLFVAFIALIYLGALPKLVPHIIEVDKLGEPKYLGPLERDALRDFKPTTPSIQYHLRRFVSDTREIPSDAAVLKRNWLEAYKLVTQNGANQLTAYVRDNSPFEQLKAQVRVTLQVNVVVAINRDTWQAEWMETTWDDHGNTIDSSTWRGTFRILLRVPASTEELALNPLGLYIDELHWARLSTPTTTERTSP